MTSRSTRLLVAVALVALLLAVSCGSDDKDGASPSTTGVSSTPATTSEPAPTTTESAPPTTATTEPMTDEEAILAAVDGYWQSFLDANNPPDPAHPDLARYSTGEALEVAVENAANRQSMGQAVKLPSETVWDHYPSELRIDLVEGSATLMDCLTDDSILYDQLSGRSLNDAISTTRFELQLVLEDGAWKVDQNLLVDKRDGVQPC